MLIGAVTVEVTSREVMSPERWQRLMTSLSAPASPGVFKELVAAHSESHRHYHAAAHIDDCLAQLDEAVFMAEAEDEIELALWFHDAIYRPASSEFTSDYWCSGP